MVDAVLSHELEGAVGVISLEDSHCPFGKRNAQAVSLAISEFDLVAGLEVGLGVASRVDGDEVVLPDGDVVDLGDELYLLLRVIVQRDWLTEGVHVIVRERFLRERGSVIGHGHHGRGYCLEHHDWLGGILYCIDITGNQFKLGILVSLSRPIINGHPSTNVCPSLILTQRHRVIRFPRESSGPVCYLAIGGDGLVAEYLPVEGGQGEKAIGQGWKVDAFDVVQHLYAIVGLEDVPGVVAQEGAVELVALIS